MLEHKNQFNLNKELDITGIRFMAITDVLLPVEKTNVKRGQSI